MSKKYPKNRFEQLRREKGLSQEELALQIGIKRETYVKYENEKVDAPLWVLKELATFYNVSIDYLIDRSDFRQVSHEYISVVTGLNENAIEKLEHEKEMVIQLKQILGHNSDTINFLLENVEGQILLCNIYHYLFGNYVASPHYEKGAYVVGKGWDNEKIFEQSHSITLSDDTGIKENDVEILASGLGAPFFFASIMEELPIIKANIASKEKYKNYGKYIPEND